MSRRAHAYAATAAAAVTAVTLAAPAAASPPVSPNPAITPGAGVAIYDASGSGGSACTLGFLATGADGTHYAFTAGHCDKGGTVLMPYQTQGNYQRIGTFAKVDNQVDSVADIALIRLDGTLPTDTRVLSRRPVSGVTSEVNTGDTLCFYGMRSGRQCGVATIDTGSSGIVATFSTNATQGDSGGPVYRIGKDGSATAVGVLNSSSNDGVADATLIEPYLKQWGLTLDITPRVPAPPQPVGYQPRR